MPRSTPARRWNASWPKAPARRSCSKAWPQLFELDAPPERIECYDNSHIMGSHPYGVMVVFGADGPMKNAYRKFAIRTVLTPGDDFAMMREVLERRFGRLLREQAEGNAGAWPDLVLIDGGAGQLSAARGVLNDLGVSDVKLVGIAKGPDRDAGREWFHTLDKDGTPRPPFQLPPRDPVLYYLQRVRDEAHRFAITTPPRRPQQDAGDQRAGRDRGGRHGAQAGAAEPFRLDPRCEAGRADRSGGRAGHQPGDGAARLRAFSPWREPGQHMT